MPAKSTASDVAERAMRSSLLSLAHRKSLGRMATRLPITRPMVRRFVAGGDPGGGAACDQPPARRGDADHGGRAGRVREPGGRRPRGGRALPGRARRPGGRRPRPQRLAEADADGPRHRPRPRPRDHRRHRRPGGRDRRLRADRHGGSHHHGPDARPVAGRPSVDMAGRRRRRGPGHPVRARDAATTTSRRSSPRAGRVRLCKGAYKEPSSVAFQDKADVDAAYERADAAPHARRHATRRSRPTTCA